MGVIREIMKRLLIIALLAAMPLLFVSCSGKKKANNAAIQEEAAQEAVSTFGSNGIYFWKTVFQLDDAEKVFLERHHVQRLYVRFFDVDYESTPITSSEDVVPVATTKFLSEKPDGVELIPTVFITVRGLEHAANKEGGISDLAGKIVTRVLNMSDYNDLGPVREIQFDCDWTGGSREHYYDLCREAKKVLAEKGVPCLSSTIRLHQLGGKMPPADRGVLMLYNTGMIRNASTRNSIIDFQDILAYIDHDYRYKGKDFPMDMAFPTFSWGILFRDGKYLGILHRSDYSDESLYTDNGDGSFLVAKDHVEEGHQLRKGDRIRPESSEYETVRSVARLARGCFGSDSGVVLYHLDSSILSNYTDDEIESIYSI